MADEYERLLAEYRSESAQLAELLMKAKDHHRKAVELGVLWLRRRDDSLAYEWLHEHGFGIFANDDGRMKIIAEVGTLTSVQVDYNKIRRDLGRLDYGITKHPGVRAYFFVDSAKYWATALSERAKLANEELENAMRIEIIDLTDSQSWE